MFDFQSHEKSKKIMEIVFEIAKYNYKLASQEETEKFIENMNESAKLFNELVEEANSN